MTLSTLTAQAREGLKDLAARTLHAGARRRAQAWLWLDAGESVQEVAARLRVTRQTIDNWAKRFQVHSTLDVPARLAPSHRTGRPRAVHGIIEPLILEVIDRDPRELGYRSTVWTAPLLAYYLGHRATGGLRLRPRSRPCVSLALEIVRQLTRVLFRVD